MSRGNKQQQLATFGYVRQNCKLNIPFVLVRLVKLYFDDYFYWNFEGNEMNKFLTAKNGDVIHSKSFKINDIIFECTMCSNGWKTGAIGCVQFYIELKYLPEYIDNFSMCIELISETIPVRGIFIKNLNDNRNGVGYSKYKLKLNEFNNVKNAYFTCKLDLKGIELKSDYDNEKYKIIKNKYYIKSIKMKRKSKFEWNIDSNLLTKLKTKTKDVFIQMQSPLFDDSWNINFQKPIDKPLGIYLRYFACPIGVNKMRIKYKFNSNCHNFKMKTNCSLLKKIHEGKAKMMRFGENGMAMTGHRDCGILISDLKGTKPIIVSVEIEITELYDTENNIIQPTDFHKYDILE